MPGCDGGGVPMRRLTHRTIKDIARSFEDDKMSEQKKQTIPEHSMYAIYAAPLTPQNHPNVGIYGIHGVYPMSLFHPPKHLPLLGMIDGPPTPLMSCDRTLDQMTRNKHIICIPCQLGWWGRGPHSVVQQNWGPNITNLHVLYMLQGPNPASLQNAWTQHR